MTSAVWEAQDGGRTLPSVPWRWSEVEQDKSRVQVQVLWLETCVQVSLSPFSSNDGTKMCFCDVLEPGAWAEQGLGGKLRALREQEVTGAFKGLLVTWGPADVVASRFQVALTLRVSVCLQLCRQEVLPGPGHRVRVRWISLQGGDQVPGGVLHLHQPSTSSTSSTSSTHQTHQTHQTRLYVHTVPTRRCFSPMSQRQARQAVVEWRLIRLD